MREDFLDLTDEEIEAVSGGSDGTGAFGGGTERSGGIMGTGT